MAFLVTEQSLSAGARVDVYRESKTCEKILEKIQFIANLQAPQGAVQKGVKYFNKTAKWTKRNEIHLVYQMWKRIRENMKMLPCEQGPPNQAD